MHAFRLTLLTYGEPLTPPVDLACISGHATGRKEDRAASARDGYIDNTMIHSLPRKLELLSLLDYRLKIPQPATPT